MLLEKETQVQISKCSYLQTNKKKTFPSVSSCSLLKKNHLYPNGFQQTGQSATQAAHEILLETYIPRMQKKTDGQEVGGSQISKIKA